MDLSNYPNLQNRLKNMKGGNKAGDYIIAGIFTVLAVFGLITLFSGEVGTGLVFTALFGLLAVVFWRGIPKSKKEAAESWARITPEELARVDMDAMQAPAFGNALITQDAIVVNGGQGPHVYPSKDILWIYGKQTTQKMYGLIPMGKTFSIQILNRNGKYLEIQSPTAQKNRKEENPMQQDILVLANVLKPRHPGIIFGYNQKVQTMTPAAIAEYVDQHNQMQ